VAHLLSHPRFELFRHDVEHALTMEVDQIFHLACPASPVHYQRNPVRTIRTAVQARSICWRWRARPGAHADRVDLRGLRRSGRTPAARELLGPRESHRARACYDEGKRCAETLATSYARQYGVEVRIARIFNTYGPRMHENDGRVVSNFVVQALAGNR